MSPTNVKRTNHFIQIGGDAIIFFQLNVLPLACLGGTAWFQNGDLSHLSPAIVFDPVCCMMVLDSLCDVIYNHVHSSDIKTTTKSSKTDAKSGSIEGDRMIVSYAFRKNFSKDLILLQRSRKDSSRTKSSDEDESQHFLQVFRDRIIVTVAKNDPSARKTPIQDGIKERIRKGVSRYFTTGTEDVAMSVEKKKAALSRIKQKMALKTTSILKAENLEQETGSEASESCSSKDKTSKCNEKAQELKSVCQNFAYKKSTLSIRQGNLGNETPTEEVFNNDVNMLSSDVTPLNHEVNRTDENVDEDETKMNSTRNSTTKRINFETEKCIQSTIANQNDIEKLNSLDLDQEMAATIEGTTREKDGTDFEIVSDKKIVNKCHVDQSEAERDSSDFRACKQRTGGGRSKATESKVNTKRAVSQKIKRKRLASNEREVEDQLQEISKKVKRGDSSSKSKREESAKYNGLRTSKRNKLSTDKSKNKASQGAKKVVEAISLDDYDKVDLSGISTVQDLHVDQIRSLVRNMERDTRDIFEGKTFCERHQEYKKGGQSRANLAYNLHYGQFTEEQQETVTDTLRQQFCYKHGKYFDYILKVLVPETMMMILSKVYNNLSVEEVRRMLIDDEYD